MSNFFSLLTADQTTIEAFAGRIRELYGRMGKAYDAAAACYGFTCNGCDENCCEERFYHHTLSEFLYLFGGIRSCDEQTRQAIFSRSRAVAERYRADDAMGRVRRIMCPLNQNGRCSLYEYRLMICRLHGVPYRMRRPDGAVTQGTGCHSIDWDMSDEKSAACIFDRTELYRELSDIEIDLRQRLRFGHRIRKTIAEMIVDIEELLAV